MNDDQVERILRTAVQAGGAAGGYTMVEALIGHPAHPYAMLAMACLTTLAAIVSNIGPKSLRPIARRIENDIENSKS